MTRFIVCILLLLPIMASADTQVQLKTNYGTIVLELDQEKAPLSSANFLQYVKDGFYDDTIFHRVIDGFMIQGGGFSSEMKKKPSREPIQNEADNGLKNQSGTVAMARTSDPHSATAQFFINVADNDFLNHRNRNDPKGWGYAVFGRVIEGMDIVDRIRQLPTTTAGPYRNVPAQPVIIEQASVVSQ